MKVFNLLASGGIGGIQVLCKYISMYSEYDNTFCFLFGEGSIYEEMKSNRSNVVSLNRYHKYKGRLDKIFKLVKLVDKYDIVVTHHASISTQFIYYILKKIRTQKKYVMTVHSCFDKELYYSYKNPFKNILYKFLLTRNLRNSDCIIFVSEAGRKSYADEFHFDLKKSVVIYNGVPIEDRVPNRIVSQTPHITYIGRLVKIKGVQLLIEAVALLKNEDKKLELTIVGDGNYRETLERMVMERQLQNIIKFEGEQTNIGQYLSKSDVFVYPSTCQEVFGISIVEAMSYGIPCVANRVGGIPEIIINGYNGYLSNETSSEGIAEALRNCLSMYDDKALAKIQNNCYETARKFSILNTVERLNNLYKSLI